MKQTTKHWDTILQLKQKPNRSYHILDYVKNSILVEMQRLISLHCTHIYKYTCETASKQKFCDVLLVKKKKGTTSSLQYMKGDVLNDKWSYDTVVVLHGCQDWYDDVIDKRVTNNIVVSSVAAVSNTIVKPHSEIDVPDLQYTQDGLGTCDISALNSAFHHMFDKDLSGLFFSQKEGYM